MAVVCLEWHLAENLASQDPRTCKIPVSSRSPRNLTNTRSLRESRMRSNGSCIADEASIESKGQNGSEPRRQRLDLGIT